MTVDHVRYGIVLHLSVEDVYAGTWMFHMDRIQAEANRFLGEPACLELDAVRLREFWRYTLYFTVQPMRAWVRS